MSDHLVQVAQKFTNASWKWFSSACLNVSDSDVESSMPQKVAGGVPELAVKLMEAWVVSQRRKATIEDLCIILEAAEKDNLLDAGAATLLQKRKY